MNTKLFRPKVEVLEDRCVPAAYYWAGANDDAVASLAGNWRTVPGVGPMERHTQPPDEDDNLYFTNAYVFNCTFDDTMPNIGPTGVITVGALVIQSGYTKTIFVANVVHLRVLGDFQMYDGTILGRSLEQGNALNRLNLDGTARWEGGTMNAMDVVNGADGSLLLAGYTNKNLVLSRLTIGGNATWTNSLVGFGDLILNESIVRIFGNLDVDTGAKIRAVDYGVSTFSIMADGRLRKTSGSGDFQIDVAFTSAGTVEVTNNSGLWFQRDATLSGTTRLTSGGHITTSYVVAMTSGRLEGYGTLNGYFQVSGGTVHPEAVGMSFPGNFQVNGTLNLGADAFLEITVTNGMMGMGAATGLSGTSSTIILAGSLYVLNYGLTLNTVNQRIYFLYYGTLQGDFSNISYFNPTWTVNGNPFHFESGKNLGYYLEVKAGAA
jgi:hypothetical protein